MSSYRISIAEIAVAGNGFWLELGKSKKKRPCFLLAGLVGRAGWSDSDIAPGSDEEARSGWREAATRLAGGRLPSLGLAGVQPQGVEMGVDHVDPHQGQCDRLRRFLGIEADDLDLTVPGDRRDLRLGGVDPALDESRHLPQRLQAAGQQRVEELRAHRQLEVGVVDEQHDRQGLGPEAGRAPALVVQDRQLADEAAGAADRLHARDRGDLDLPAGEQVAVGCPLLPSPADRLARGEEVGPGPGSEHPEVALREVLAEHPAALQEREASLRACVQLVEAELFSSMRHGVLRP